MVEGTLLVLCLLIVNAHQFGYKHHNNVELIQVLETVHEKCPNITRIYTLSESSVRGVPLYMIEFSTKPGHHEILKPEFKYIANMHGNEVLGRELMLSLIHHLCEKYSGRDPEVQALIEKTRIHIMPSMNPDGWQLATETNCPKENYTVVPTEVCTEHLPTLDLALQYYTLLIIDMDTKD